MITVAVPLIRNYQSSAIFVSIQAESYFSIDKALIDSKNHVEQS